MLDIQFIRDNPDLIRYAAERRGSKLDLQPLFDVDDERKKISLSLQAKKARLRVLERLSNTGDAQAHASLSTIQAECVAEETQYSEALQRFKREMILIPNLPDISVPTGGETERTVEVGRSERQIPAENTLREALVRARVALIPRGENTWMTVSEEYVSAYNQLNALVRKHFKNNGFVITPTISGVSREACIASGARSEELSTYLSDVSFGCVGTTTIPYLFDVFGTMPLTEDALPARHAVQVSLFRESSERTFGTSIGTLTACAPRHDVSVEQHEALRQCYESLFSALQIPYKTVVVTARAAHLSSVKSYEIEIPIFTHPYSAVRVHYYHDFQARRAGMRYMDTTGKQRFVHTIASDGLCIEELLALVHTVHGDSISVFLDHALA